MNYLLFLLLFICPPIVWLVFLQRRRLRANQLLLVMAVAVIAIAYTTPWDNYLVASGVWYYNPALVLKVTLGWVPIEEYLFFVLQTFLTGLVALWLWRRLYPQDFGQDQR
jgi:lycopene cyclase domain-containing protein